jgi:hypothetical protein
MSGKGGMCRSPFGRRWVEDKYVNNELKPAHWESNPRLDKTDELLKEILNGDTDPNFAVFAAPFLKAIHNYKYWALGDNKTTDVKWQDAHDYLFVTRATNPATWGSREMRYTEDLDDGKRITHRLTLSDAEMRVRCFDVHYELLGLDKVLPMESFLRMLQHERETVIKVNRDQVLECLASIRSEEFCRLPYGTQMNLTFTVHDLVKTLTRPDSIRQLEELVLFSVPDPKYRLQARALQSSCRVPHASYRMKPAKNQERVI